MESHAKLLGHAAHPLLVTLPIGMLVLATGLDVWNLFGGGDQVAAAAAYAIAAGVLAGVIAAVPGWIDWAAIPHGTRARRVGITHGLGNSAMLALFAVSFVLRTQQDAWEPPAAAYALSFAGLAILGFTGWLGGELVERLGVSVSRMADLDAPPSIGPKGNEPLAEVDLTDARMEGDANDRRRGSRGGDRSVRR